MMDIKSPVGEGRNTYTYAADGRKLKVIQQWNSNYSTSPVIGSAITVSSLNQTKTTEYAGNMIYENGILKRILIDGGYIEGGVYYYYLRDHLGNNRVVANASGTVIQRTHYYPFGMAFAETSSTEQGLQPYKYNNKELDRMHGLNLYDYEARYMEPALGGLRTMDPLAEKYYSWTPYGYCGGNPIRYVDLHGDSLTLAGELVNIQSSANIANNAMGGFYTISVNSTTGLVSITATDQQGTMTSEQQAFYDGFSNIINDNRMTTVNVVSGDQNVLIGDAATATIDVGDMNVIGSGHYVNDSGTFIHEINEQYRIQVQGSNLLSAHIGATQTEGRVTGNIYNPERPISGPITGTGTVTVPVKDPSSGQTHNVTIHYQNGNVTGITR